MRSGRHALLCATALAAIAGCGGGDDGPNVDLGKPPGCFAEAAAPGNPTATGGVIGGAPSDDPVAECGRYWTNGGIAKRDAVPPLVACVGNNGTPWVFPGDDEDTCKELGLPQAEVDRE